MHQSWSGRNGSRSIAQMPHDAGALTGAPPQAWRAIAGCEGIRGLRIAEAFLGLRLSCNDSINANTNASDAILALAVSRWYPDPPATHVSAIAAQVVLG
jgi:hypothetical protein